MVLIAGLVIGGPWLAYVYSYMVARGRFDGIRDSKMKLAIKNLFNLKNHVKEN